MIDELNEALRRLLIREMPIKNGEIDISFDQPKREWSSRLSKPTLNLFLHDLRENTTLRQHEWQTTRNGDGTYTRQRSSIRLDLYYMITAWVANHPDDEHRLLSRALLALFRYPLLPKEVLPDGLLDQPAPIPVRVAQPEDLRNPADVWSAMDNELRPAIACMITLALNPYRPFTGPLVRTRELRFGEATGLPERQEFEEGGAQDRFWMVGGYVKSKEPLHNGRLVLVERGQEVPLQDQGRFVIGNLEAGEYTLELSAEGRRPKRQKIIVPSLTYDLEL